MKIYSDCKDYKLYCGNMLEVLDTMDENSIGAVVTDPPYELGFMGKSWDSSGIAFQKETWEKCLRVLKPGGYLLAFGGSRTFHRIACAIEDAGFEIRDTIMYLYGTGFPKSMNIGKQIDKKGANQTAWFGQYLKNVLKEKGMKQSDLSRYFLSRNGETTGRVSNWIKGTAQPTNEQFNYVCQILDLPFENMVEAKREVVGNGCGGLARGKIASFSGSGEYDITLPHTDLAKKWDSYGTQLKPAYEPIIVARKPVEGNITENVMKYGVGAINIDECRIELEDNFVPKTTVRAKRDDSGVFSDSNCGIKNDKNNIASANESGRFPSNVILSYDDETYNEVCGGFPDSDGCKPHKIYSNTEKYEGYGSITKKSGEMVGYPDSGGSASRYFYCAKASSKDRDEGLDYFEKKTSGDLTERKDGSAGITAFTGSRCPKSNFHPTVKPVDLMQYLVRLVTPKGETVLDPFMGSGSTGKAVMFENRERDANYKFIGVELTEEYLPICEARIEYARDKYKYDIVEDENGNKTEMKKEELF